MKKKNLKRALVLGLVLANIGLWGGDSSNSAFGSVAYAATHGTVDTDGYNDSDIISNIKNGQTTGVMFDGGWYAPDNKFYTYVDPKDGKLNTKGKDGNGTPWSYERSSNGGPAVIDPNGDGSTALNNAQVTTLKAMGLDHLSQADSIWDHDAIPSYTDYMDDNGFTKESVAKLLGDNLKFNSDLNRTLVEIEEANRKATDKHLNEKIEKINASQSGNTLTFANGKGETQTFTFTDTNTDTNTTVSGVATDINSSGIITTTVQSSDGTSKSDTVNISNFVNSSIINNAGDATVTIGGNTTTIEEAINNNYSNITSNTTNIATNTQNITTNTQNIANNTTEITNIKNNYVTNITDGDSSVTNRNNHTWTITQIIDGKPETVTIKDLNTTNESLTNTWANDDITITLTDTDNQQVTTTLSNIAKASDVDNLTTVIGAATTEEIVNRYGDTYYITNEETLIDADIKLDQEIKNINDNNVTNITKNDNNSWTVTQTIDGTPNDVTITDTITTASLGNSTNLTLNETIGQNNNTIHYTIDLKDDVTFNSVTAKDINGTTGNFITVNSATVNADAVNANTVTAGKVNTAEVNATVGNIGTVNANAVNAGAVNANQVGTATIYLGTSTDYATIKYDAANDRINYNDEVIATLNDGMKYGADQGTINSLKLNDTLTVSGDKNITTISNGTGQIAVTLNDEISVSTVNSATVNSTTVNSETVNSNTVNSTTMNTTTLNVGDSITIEEGNVDMGGNTITNVYEGGIYQGSMDAINGGQLWQTNQRLDSLDNRVDKVGAGAAALAALHPLDFDPDDKLSFSAGVGNYAGATASAIGAFYRPDERTMFSIGSTVGNGENMVNAGVSFALGKGGKVTKSRVAMVHEINDLRQQVAELTAMVSQLAAIHSNFKFDSMSPFPDTPENHWAYEYIGKLAAEGIVEGYPDGNFSGDRAMTRYEFGAMLYRALQKGFTIDERLIDEFEPEIGRLSVERIKGELNQRNKIERVRINDEGEDRDVYGGKITVGKTW